MGGNWQIGDPVDYTTDGWMDAQNWGHGCDDDENSNFNITGEKTIKYS